MKKTLFAIIILMVTSEVFPQNEDGNYLGRKIRFPEINGYKTLVTDLHMHTVFSDGYVWPNIRVEEALRDGLDAISVTDHIEYQPNRKDIPHPDRNRSYEIALDAAEDTELMVLNGGEVTRNMPPGHINGVFLEDVNKLNINDSIMALKEAKKQGAFIFWNHPHWEAQYPDGMAKLTDLHKDLINKGLLNGIEVVNDITYSDEALQIALDYNLTIIGTSDIHGLIDWHYDVPGGGHRSVTLVFAKEKSAESMKEALFAGRTVVFFNDQLIGKENYVIPLIENSLTVDSAEYIETWSGKTMVAKFLIHNNYNATLILENRSNFGLHNYTDMVVLKPHSSTEIQVKTIEVLNEFELRFRVLNAVIAPQTHPEISISIPVSRSVN